MLYVHRVGPVLMAVGSKVRVAQGVDMVYWPLVWLHENTALKGMTPAEVEAILGLPPGDYTVLRQIADLDATGPEFLYTSGVFPKSDFLDVLGRLVPGPR